MDIRGRLEAAISPLGFVHLFDEHGSPVYGRIRKIDRHPVVTQRLYSFLKQRDDLTWDFNCIDPSVRIRHYVKEGETVLPYRSTRWVKMTSGWEAVLVAALEDWKEQLRWDDESCHKCGGTGTYKWRFQGQDRSGQCNRCCGKGYQNFNDLVRCRGYDRRTQFLQLKLDLGIPHWCPDPANLLPEDEVRRRVEEDLRRDEQDRRPA